MSLRYQLVLGLMAAFSGCMAAGGQGLVAATGAAGATAGSPPPLLAAASQTTRGGNLVQFEVDGQVHSFRTPEVRHSRARVADTVAAFSFELANADNSLSARLVLQVPEETSDLSGEYPAVALDDPAQRGRVGVGELVLAEETDASRGRRMLPSGSGLIVVDHQAGRLKVAFSTGGDGLFRETAAEPIVGTLDFHWVP